MRMLPGVPGPATALRLTLRRCQLAGVIGEMLSAGHGDLTWSTLTGRRWFLARTSPVN
jgi:hypothetical protein